MSYRNVVVMRRNK